MTAKSAAAAVLAAALAESAAAAMPKGLRDDDLRILVGTAAVEETERLAEERQPDRWLQTVLEAARCDAGANPGEDDRERTKSFILPGVPRPGASSSVVDRETRGIVAAIYDGRYDSAVVKARRRVELGVCPVHALELLGSAYFMMDDKTKAEAAWKRALELDPKNKIVSEFLRLMR